MKNFILLIIMFTSSFTALCQGGPAVKMHDVFIEYIHDKLPLSSQETDRARPLIIRYLTETRKLHKEFTDPLIRDQQIIALKIRYRNLFMPIIGNDRSNRFFIEEQLFRKKVRDELRKRRKL